MYKTDINNLLFFSFFKLFLSMSSLPDVFMQVSTIFESWMLSVIWLAKIVEYDPIDK